MLVSWFSSLLYMKFKSQNLFLRMCFVFPTGHHNLSYILDNEYGRYSKITLA